MERCLNYDVVVAGGGTAGTAAAIGAAKAGAKTLLIERNAYCGGNATNAGVSSFCGFYTCGENPVKVVAGAGDCLLDAMRSLDPSSVEIVISASGNQNINFKPEYLKCAIDNVLEETGVDVLLHTRVIAAETEDKQVTKLLLSDDAGQFSVRARAFVDATGDANLTAMCGGKTVWGGSDGKVQAATLTFRMSGVDTAADLSPAAVERAVKKAKEAGIPHLTRERGFILKIDGSNLVSVLLPSMMPQSLDAAELTRMETDTRKQTLSYVKALKEYLPGMEQAELAVIGPSIGFRETRKIVGLEQISADDVLNRRKRADGVARGGWKPEIHKSLNEAATYVDVKEGSYFDIPLSALQSESFLNLYGAGRNVSADEEAFAAVRVMGTCFATGQAAGAAAALQAKGGGAVPEAYDVRRLLQKQDALV